MPSDTSLHPVLCIDAWLGAAPPSVVRVPLGPGGSPPNFFTSLFGGVSAVWVDPEGSFQGALDTSLRTDGADDISISVRYRISHADPERAARAFLGRRALHHLEQQLRLWVAEACQRAAIADSPSLDAASRGIADALVSRAQTLGVRLDAEVELRADLAPERVPLHLEIRPFDLPSRVVSMVVELSASPSDAAPLRAARDRGRVRQILTREKESVERALAGLGTHRLHASDGLGEHVMKTIDTTLSGLSWQLCPAQVTPPSLPTPLRVPVQVSHPVEGYDLPVRLCVEGALELRRLDRWFAAGGDVQGWTEARARGFATARLESLALDDLVGRRGSLEEELGADLAASALAFGYEATVRVEIRFELLTVPAVAWTAELDVSPADVANRTLPTHVGLRLEEDISHRALAIRTRGHMGQLKCEIESGLLALLRRRTASELFAEVPSIRDLAQVELEPLAAATGRRLVIEWILVSGLDRVAPLSRSTEPIECPIAPTAKMLAVSGVVHVSVTDPGRLLARGPALLAPWVDDQMRRATLGVLASLDVRALARGLEDERKAIQKHLTEAGEQIGCMVLAQVVYGEHPWAKFQRPFEVKLDVRVGNVTCKVRADVWVRNLAHLADDIGAGREPDVQITGAVADTVARVLGGLGFEALYPEMRGEPGSMEGGASRKLEAAVRDLLDKDFATAMSGWSLVVATDDAGQLGKLRGPHRRLIVVAPGDGPPEAYEADILVSGVLPGNPLFGHLRPVPAQVLGAIELRLREVLSGRGARWLAEQSSLALHEQVRGIVKADVAAWFGLSVDVLAWSRLTGPTPRTDGTGAPRSTAPGAEALRADLERKLIQAVEKENDQLALHAAIDLLDARTRQADPEVFGGGATPAPVVLAEWQRLVEATRTRE